jgi:Predicted acyltransferases
MQPKNECKLRTLQAGRAIAAILVVLGHCSREIFFLPKYWGLKPFGRALDFGHSGVEFFFVLSGFIIFHVHQQDLDMPERLSRFLRKRWLRVYPIYYIVFAGMLAAFFAHPAWGKGHERQMTTILSSIALVKFWPVDPVLPVAWTLFHEVKFYCAFGLAIVSVRIGTAMAAALVAGTVFQLVYGSFAFPLDFLLSPFNLLFALGALAAQIYNKHNTPVPWACLLAGMALFGATAVEEIIFTRLTDDVRSLLYGFGSALCILGAAELERTDRMRVWRGLTLLGDASYSIYLTHFPLLSLLAKVFLASGLNTSIPPSLSFIIMVVLVVLMGLATHLVIERPLLAFFRRRLLPPGARSAA